MGTLHCLFGERNTSIICPDKFVLPLRYAAPHQRSLLSRQTATSSIPPPSRCVSYCRSDARHVSFADKAPLQLPHIIMAKSWFPQFQRQGWFTATSLFAAESSPFISFFILFPCSSQFTSVMWVSLAPLPNKPALPSTSTTAADNPNPNVKLQVVSPTLLLSQIKKCTDNYTTKKPSTKCKDQNTSPNCRRLIMIFTKTQGTQNRQNLAD